MTELYHLPNIRELLTHGFTDTELRDLCFDYFRPVHDPLAQNSGKTEIVAKLLEYADNKSQLDILLALARARNPARYTQHEPYYTDNPILTLQKLVSDLAQQLVALTSSTTLTRER